MSRRVAESQISRNAGRQKRTMLEGAGLKWNGWAGCWRGTVDRGRFQELEVAFPGARGPRHRPCYQQQGVRRERFGDRARIGGARFFRIFTAACFRYAAPHLARRESTRLQFSNNQ